MKNSEQKKKNAWILLMPSNLNPMFMISIAIAFLTVRRINSETRNVL